MRSTVTAYVTMNAVHTPKNTRLTNDRIVCNAWPRL